MSELWNFEEFVAPSLLTTLGTLSLAGKTTFVTDDVPYFSFDPFGCKYRKALFLPTDCSMDAQRFHRDYSRFYPALLATVRQVPRAHMLNTSRYFCGETTCDMTRGGKLLYPRSQSPQHQRFSDSWPKQILNDYPAFAAAVTRTQNTPA